jgi:hypothetical protein
MPGGPELSRTDRSPSIAAITEALIEAQAEFGPTVASAKNPHFGSTYVDLFTALEAVRAGLRKFGLLVIQTTRIGDRPIVRTDKDGRVIELPETLLVTTLSHKSGEWISGEYPLRPIRDDPQMMGSAFTYARRYCVMAMLGLAPEDEDGHAASGRDEPARQPRERTRERAPRERRASAPEGEPERRPASKAPDAKAQPEIPRFFAQWAAKAKAAAKEGDPNEFQLARHVYKFCRDNKWIGELDPNPSHSDIAGAVGKAWETKAPEIMAEGRRYIFEKRKAHNDAASAAAEFGAGANG